MDSLTKREEEKLPHISHGLMQRVSENWGWVVTLGVTIIWFLIVGSQYVYALTFLKLQQDFNGSATMVGLIGSIYLSLGCGLSPVTSLLQRRYSHRMITIMAVLITSVSYILSSFMDSLIFLVFTFGVLSGIGYNFVYTSLNHLLVCYFPSKKCRGPIAIANAGQTIAQLGLSPAIEKLLSLYGWRWTLRIQGTVICLVGLLACIVLKKPPVWKTSEKEDKKSKKCHSGQLMAVLKLPETWIFSMSTFLTGVASTFLYVYIGSYIVSKGLSEEQSATGMMLIGCGSLAVCLIGSILINRICFPVIYLIPVVCVLKACTFTIMTFVQTFRSVNIMCLVIGVLRTGYNILLVPPAVELLGTSRALEATTIAISSLGFGYFSGSYVSGKMFDAFGSYDIALYICAALYITSATLALIAPLYQRYFVPDRYMVDIKVTAINDENKNVLTSTNYERLFIEERESVI
ncbi:monocarboxylate transporter 11-like [Anneissia japonica]|uniref:monocarboxylate transporter 11-like n=1 Tax=Anneissia japonica TaxID=1529436 RepID=UPI0014257547|nr:monocarboxylate transporter 11-like [Anneissia japonica]XP_033125776.1 monocarboxylate transporter 11-like [Anneissia japonica]XP_033125778.1 monocarboxylate transporter 11-like [Anneissia japonica]